METRVPSSFINRILAKSYFTNFISSEANGFAGGIWILWDAAVLHVEPLTFDDQVINVLVKRGQDPYWFLSAIYASPKLNFRNDLWHYLECIGTGLSFPWLLIGDFNQVLGSHDKRGGARVCQARVRPFQTMINSCELVDLGFVGPRYTWSNMHRGSARVEERLDRCLCNTAWLRRFPD